MRLQAGLGDVYNLGRGDIDNQGKLTLARVVSVNNRDHTADVIMMTGAYLGNQENSTSRVSCMRLEQFAGFNSDSLKSYGSVTPLRKGDLVLVAFVDSGKNKPIILGSVYMPDNTITNMPEVESMGEFEDEKDEYYSVDPNQNYNYSNAQGEFENVNSNGLYKVGKTERMSDHRENAFGHEDLSIRDKWTYRTIDIKEEEFQPFNYLLVTRDKHDETDENTVFNRFYHDPKRGITRFSKDSKNKLLYVEVDKGFKIQYQKNSNRRPKRADENIYEHKTLRKSNEDFLKYVRQEKELPDFQKIKDFVRFEIEEDGSLVLKVQDNNVATEIKVKGNNVSIDSEGSININSNKSINLTAPSVNISETSPGVDIREEDKENEWEQQWINPTEKDGDGV